MPTGSPTEKGVNQLSPPPCLGKEMSPQPEIFIPPGTHTVPSPGCQGACQPCSLPSSPHLRERDQELGLAGEEETLFPFSWDHG